MATKKKVIKEEPVKKINFWQLASDVEDVCIKLEQIKSLLAVTAESVFDSEEANLIWLSVDLMDKEMQKLDAITNKIMDVHKETFK